MHKCKLKIGKYTLSEGIDPVRFPNRIWISCDDEGGDFKEIAVEKEVIERVIHEFYEKNF